jgi:hypothetical protein
MAMLKVSKSGMDTPQGPTGHLRSGAKGVTAGGSKRPMSKGKKGIVCSPARSMRGGRR